MSSTRNNLFRKANLKQNLSFCLPSGLWATKTDTFEFPTVTSGSRGIITDTVWTATASDRYDLHRPELLHNIWPINVFPLTQYNWKLYRSTAQSKKSHCYHSDRRYHLKNMLVPSMVSFILSQSQTWLIFNPLREWLKKMGTRTQL